MKKYNAPRVKRSRGIQIFTTIWMVPIVALIIALWLAFQYYSKIGSLITIRFEANAGLVENQSPIKMRDVTVGIVKKISLADDGKGVIVKAQINKDMDNYLNKNSRFWIVHADVGSHGVSGLDTIVSGSYIALHSKKGEKEIADFIGLDEPYIDREASGQYYKLSAPFTHDVTEGSNVYYRMAKVGRVERVSISHDGKRANFMIFVEEQYTRFINSRSLFYTRSNFAFDFSQGKLDFNIAGLSQIVHGGVSIYTPCKTLDESHPIQKGHIFPLYESLSEMKAKHLATGKGNRVYRLIFDEDITKLEVGSPVEFQGFQVGYVTDIESHYNHTKQAVESEVFALIHTKAFQDDQNSSSVGEQTLEVLVTDGLKAQLNTAIPIVGSQFIDLIFDHNQTLTISKTEPYYLFPTIKSKPSSDLMGEANKLLISLQELTQSLNSMVDTNQQPINQLLVDLDKTVKNFNITLQGLNKITANEDLAALPTSLNDTVMELQTTLQEIQKLTNTYGENSRFSDQLSSTLKTLSETLKAIKQTNTMLNRNPNALIIGDQ